MGGSYGFSPSGGFAGCSQRHSVRWWRVGVVSETSVSRSDEVAVALNPETHLIVAQLTNGGHPQRSTSRCHYIPPFHPGGGSFTWLGAIGECSI